MPLTQGFSKFVENHEWSADEVRPETVVIYISMRDRDKYEYASCPIPLDNKTTQIKSSGSGYFCGVEE
jgi:hypothetical protein